MTVTDRPDTLIKSDGEQGGPVNPQDSVSRENKLSGWAELSKFSKFTVYILIFNLLVIGYGVFVRASKSGDGCGSHWPLCNGNSHPLNGPISRIVEGAHRVSTSLDGLLVVVMLFWALYGFPRKAQVKTFALITFAFIIVEGLIGAILVKGRLVADNASADRAFVMSFHVISTFMLVGAMTLSIFTGSHRKLALKGQGAVGWMLGLSFLVTCVLGVSGAISALGHTLDPVHNVLKAAANPTTFWMVRLQPMHPYLAVAGGMFLVLTATLVAYLRPSPAVRRSAAVFMGAFGLEMLVGIINIKMFAPIAVQMIHLASADALVVSLVWFIAEAIREGVPQREASEAEPKAISTENFKETVKQFAALTKPRVISLLLFTTLASMFAAAGGWPGFWKLIMVAVGGYLAAGAANTYNMVAERDLDRAMTRTRTRPTITDAIPARVALGFAIILTFASFAILCTFANLLSAVLAEAGLVFYVSIYTLGLKRRTWQNIVIGGAAGAFPPLVGWASVHDSLGLLAWCLFGIVFLWTPVHFWALAILLKDDYAEAGVPMLPTVKGVAITTKQIAFYTALTVAISLLPFAERWSGFTYLASVALLDVWLIVLTLRLLNSPERKQASSLFHYSMIYLALLFVAFAVDQSMTSPWNRVHGVSSSTVTSMRVRVDRTRFEGARVDGIGLTGLNVRTFNLVKGADLALWDHMNINGTMN